MKVPKFLISSLLVLTALCGYRAQSADSFTAGNDGHFLLNGKPFVIKAAELHYPRIPRPYWDQRIKMCKAMGMNTICMYVFWNVHESEPGVFDFSGQNDIAEFIRLCRDNDMYVILRPGPYVCAEWDMGGLPWWLLQKEDIRLREQDPYFMERVDIFQKAVAGQIKDYLITNSGPILMIQVENEYGSYGVDKPYISAIRDMLRSNFGDDMTMFQCDWSSNFLDNGLDDLVWTMNFGSWSDVDEEFAKLKEVRPDAPMMCSEYWSGWYDHWGAPHETRPAEPMVAGIDKMLSQDISFSLYMAHGGTNRGHWAGANSPGYAPDVTSYDYDAPINEQGAPTYKFYELQSVMAKYHEGKVPAMPDTVPVGEIAQFAVTEVAPLFDNLPEPMPYNELKPMEMYGQGFGSILYRTHIPALADTILLTVDEPHDYAQIFIDGKKIGTLDRCLEQKTISLPPTDNESDLDILVEATGRINFGRSLADRKGITQSVTLGDKMLDDWTIYLLPDSLDFYGSQHFTPVAALNDIYTERLPAGAYKGTFEVTDPADTYLDMSGWGKGLVYVNGHALGRFWEIGPQQTIYLPGCWLNQGENTVMIYDILGPHSPNLQGLTTPISNRLK